MSMDQEIIMDIKIKIEGTDLVMAAAIGAAVAKGLEAEGFLNVTAKVVMVYQELNLDPLFNQSGKVNQLNQVIDQQPVPSKPTRPPLTLTEIVPAQIGLGYPEILEHLRATRPADFHQPILIDTGMDTARCLA